MNIWNKLKFFGKKSDLYIPEKASVLLEEMVKMNPELFEAYKTYIYAKMTVLARRLINASKEEVELLQAKIKVLDETIKDLEKIGKFPVEETESGSFRLTSEELLEKIVGNKKEKVASEKRKTYTVDDYLASKDFNGVLG